MTTFDPDELIRWAETYGHPEEWAKKAQELHRRCEALEGDLAACRGIRNIAESTTSPFPIPHLSDGYPMESTEREAVEQVIGDHCRAYGHKWVYPGNGPADRCQRCGIVRVEFR